jgi:hypothetical protein
MFRRIRPSTQSYQVATECGEPSGRTVATTAGFGCFRNSSISGGTGGGGIPRAYVLSGRVSQYRFRPW